MKIAKKDKRENKLFVFFCEPTLLFYIKYYNMLIVYGGNMKLQKIIQGINDLKRYNFKDVAIEGLHHNHKTVTKNSIFFCINGTKLDGHEYAEEAVARGAICLVVERKVDVPVTQILVEDVRLAMSQMAANFYDNAHKKLQIISIIGTNGKTTTSFIIKSILESAKKRVAVIGTMGVFMMDKHLDIDFTTPDPIILHHILKQLKTLEIDYVIMEVSAHAIALHKMAGIVSRVGAFTNISKEHLDFFASYEDYIATKTSYFSKRNMKECVVNIDCPFGQELARSCGIPCISYGLENPSNIFAVDVKADLSGITAFVNAVDEVFKMESALVGEVNVYNLLCAIGVCRLLGISNEHMQRGIKSLKRVEGRFNLIKLPDNNSIVIDFAHTPDGFEKTLSFIRKNTKGKVVTLFGCVGYSDEEKRRDMAKMARQFSDFVIVTSDNPGKVSFDSISKSILAGFGANFKEYAIIEDREKAVAFGYKKLFYNDVLVLLGKGGEESQNKGGIKIPYNEKETVYKVLHDNKVEEIK